MVENKVPQKKSRKTNASNGQKAWILKLEEFEMAGTANPTQEMRTKNASSQTATHFIAEEELKNHSENDEKLTTGWLLSHIDIHGFSTWVETNKLAAKACWGALILCAFLALCYGIYKSTHDYYNNPILTTFSIVPRRKMDFPEVYICPTNFINQSYVDNTQTDLEWAKYYWARASNDSGILAEKSTVWESLFGYPDEAGGNPTTKQPEDFQVNQQPYLST